MDRVTVTEASQVAEARRRAVAAAQSIGFDETAAGRVALVVTELATNVVKYGVPGEILVGTFEDATGSGVEILALDKGGGFSDLGSALRDGHSTGGSSGEGLGAVRRLSDAFDIASRPGVGSAVLARLSGVRTTAASSAATFGAVTVPLRGETANGDAYAVHERSDGWTAVVADGLGHGPEAAKASEEALRWFRHHRDKSPGAILSAIHAGLPHTRGGAVSVARYDRDAGILTFAGIGNVLGAVVSDAVTKRTVSLAAPPARGPAHPGVRVPDAPGRPVRPVFGRDRHRMVPRRLPRRRRGTSVTGGGGDLSRLRPGPRRRHRARRSGGSGMRWPLLATQVEHEDDIVTVRQRVRRLAERLGFEVQDQTRIATAVSEIARNAYGYAGGGRVEYGLDEGLGGQSLVIRVIDKGPGIPHLDEILEGRYRSTTGLGIGITGSRRLMDRFEIETETGKGTVATFAKQLPHGTVSFTGKRLATLAEDVARARTDEPLVALREQNRELLRSLAELAEREEEAQRLNRELAETNRGVVALHAELEDQAERLREVGASLETQVAARTAELAEANAPSPRRSGRARADGAGPSAIAEA